MSRRELAGLAAAACIACCAGPLLAVLGGITALGVVGAALVGTGALLVSAVAIVIVLAVRRAHRSVEPEPQRVDLGPTRRGSVLSQATTTAHPQSPRSSG